MEERTRRKIEEKERSLRRESEYGWMKEEEEKKREKNVIWREVEGDSKEERICYINVIIEEILEQDKEMNGIEKSRGEAVRWIMITEMRKIEDKQDTLDRGGEINRKWGIGVDKDPTMEERRMRWKIKETARRERTKRKRVETRNRELWMENNKWNWDEKMERGGGGGG